MPERGDRDFSFGTFVRSIALKLAAGDGFKVGKNRDFKNSQIFAQFPFHEFLTQIPNEQPNFHQKLQIITKVLGIDISCNHSFYSEKIRDSENVQITSINSF